MVPTSYVDSKNHVCTYGTEVSGEQRILRGEEQGREEGSGVGGMRSTHIMNMKIPDVTQNYNEYFQRGGSPLTEYGDVMPP